MSTFILLTILSRIDLRMLGRSLFSTTARPRYVDVLVKNATHRMHPFLIRITSVSRVEDDDGEWIFFGKVPLLMNDRVVHFPFDGRFRTDRPEGEFRVYIPDDLRLNMAQAAESPTL